MRLKFKQQSYQTEAVAAVADCFRGQPLITGITYRIDPGRQMEASGQLRFDEDQSGFRNPDIALTVPELLRNVHAVQQHHGLPLSTSLKSTAVSPVNLDIEMETGTGKTYCYIKTTFELSKRYGWSKFIVVVPSIAIREGVAQSFQDTADHFLEHYGKRARWFLYNSKNLSPLESFSSDAGINVMIINVQAFNARGQDARRIYEELDDFQSRKPIDVIKRNRPILILDEPQKMEGAKTVESLKEFSPLMVLRYSATHKQQHDRVYRLDALDAYNRKLVKKIGVRGIALKGLEGTKAYLFLAGIETSAGLPEARLDFEARHASGIKREMRRVGRNDNLHDKSKELDQYKGFVVADINAITNTLTFSNGHVLQVGEATGDVNEAALRRIQIREAIDAHFEKEQQLFARGVKVLSLFFIDEVSKYRRYDDTGEQPGEYAEVFEEEYNARLNEVLTLEDTPYNRYLKAIQTSRTHAGYFSIDKKSKRLVNPSTAARTTEADDVDAYDLILKDKKRLLSLEEPVRFIFSHSALREGWDNPNVFFICALKHSDNTISRRREVGRGMRLCVNQQGDRLDHPATVHEINNLTVVASESYKTFVEGLQRDIKEAVSARPRKANVDYFTGKLFKTESSDVLVTPKLARAIYQYLVKNNYVDGDDHVTAEYHDAKQNGTLAPVPAEYDAYATHIHNLVGGVFSDAQLPPIGDDRKSKSNPLNQNFHKQEFQDLWTRINRKAAYTVHFETPELVKKCIAALDKELKVSPLQYTVERGEQTAEISYDQLRQGKIFETTTIEPQRLRHASIRSAVKYDLIGKVAEQAKLTRRTVGTILCGMNLAVFSQYRTNPEDFIMRACRIVNEQKATVIVEHLTYSPVEDRHTTDIFTQPKRDLSSGYKAGRHIYDYVFTDSGVEREFVEQLDKAIDVVVYAKLPKAFTIPTPVGEYNPDWAIAFQQGAVKHVYFIAETKGSLSSMELREVGKSKIECARRFFSKITTDQVKYDVVNSYAKLMELVK